MTEPEIWKASPFSVLPQCASRLFPTQGTFSALSPSSSLCLSESALGVTPTSTCLKGHRHFPCFACCFATDITVSYLFSFFSFAPTFPSLIQACHHSVLSFYYANVQTHNRGNYHKMHSLYSLSQESSVSAIINFLNFLSHLCPPPSFLSFCP